MDSFVKMPFGSQRFSGYSSDPSNASPDYVSMPCQNMLVTDDGTVEQRLGYRQEFVLATVGESAPFYHSTYDVAFFAVGTKVYYRDFSTNTTYDTGITLTTGTTTRFEEIEGDIVLSNTTDGVKRFCVGRVNDAAATSGDATFTVDIDFLGRMTAFGDTTSVAFIINGTSETVASFVLATGVCTHATTLSQSYADNSIVLFYDNSHTGLDKFSKLLLFKHRLHGMGFPSASNADQPNNTVLTGKYIIGQAGASGIEDVMSFPLDGTLGSVKISVLGGGKVTNMLGVADYIYFFTENKVFNTAASSISTSGSTLGLTIPEEKDTLHGCLNEDCATVMGNSSLTYVTTDHRIMEIPIDTESGAAIAAPREDFDVDIRDHLKNMSEDQTGAFAYHYRGGRQTIYQLKIAGQWLWFIFDHNIIREQGSNFVRGAWQPPQNIGYFKGLFERKGVLYGTGDAGEVFSIFTTFTDNLSPIYAIFATGEFNCGNAMVKNAELQGIINQPSQIDIKCYVTNETSGRRCGSTKTILGSSYSYGSDFSVGAVPVGEGGNGETTQIAKWKRGFGVFPSEATRVQLIAENFQDGGWFAINAYSLDGVQYPRPFSRSL